MAASTELCTRHVPYSFRHVHTMSLSSTDRHTTRKRYICPSSITITSDNGALAKRCTIHYVTIQPHATRTTCPTITSFFPRTIRLHLHGVDKDLTGSVIATTRFAVFAFRLFRALAFDNNRPSVATPNVPLVLTGPSARDLQHATGL